MLTDRQKRFIDAYSGNAAEAARAAGYSSKTADKIASQLMDKQEIIDAIHAREKERTSAEIMTREQRQIFWSTITRDTSQRIADRLRASELLAKSEGDFIERRELIDKTPSVTIQYEYIQALQRDDGTNINPDENPEEYAEVWARNFLKEHHERTERQ